MRKFSEIHEPMLAELKSIPACRGSIASLGNLRKERGEGGCQSGYFHYFIYYSDVRLKTIIGTVELVVFASADLGDLAHWSELSLEGF